MKGRGYRRHKMVVDLGYTTFVGTKESCLANTVLEYALKDLENENLPPGQRYEAYFFLLSSDAEVWCRLADRDVNILQSWVRETYEYDNKRTYSKRLRRRRTVW